MNINRRTMLARTGKTLGVLVLSLAIACSGGGFIKSFRVALTAFGPLATSLNLPGATVVRITKDADDGAQCAQTLQSDFSGIPADDPNKTSLKLNASVKAMRCWRVVVDRQNFAAHPRIQQAANIADGVLASLVVFYSEPGEMRNSTSRSATVAARDEADLEKQLREKVKELERALRP